MATGLNASLKFGPAPKAGGSASKLATGEVLPIGSSSDSRATSSSRRRRNEAEAWQAECLRAADKLGAAVPEEEDAAPSSEWRAQIEHVLAKAVAAEARAATHAVLSPAELDLSIKQLAVSDAPIAATLTALRAEHKATEAAVGVLQQELGSRHEYAAALEQELAILNKMGAGNVGCHAELLAVDKGMRMQRVAGEALPSWWSRPHAGGEQALDARSSSLCLCLLLTCFSQLSLYSRSLVDAEGVFP